MTVLSRSVWLLSLATIVLVCAAVWILLWSYKSEKSGFSPATAKNSVGNHYLDEQVCADCHEEQSAGHKKTGHANTFSLSSESETSRMLDGQSFNDPERGYNYFYHLDETGLSVSIPSLGNESFPLTYALGSGHNALTFLTLVPDRFGDTMGIEHRVSLYPSDHGWELDLTPGHKTHVPQQEIELFGKVMQGDMLTRCVACHTTTADLKRQSIDNLAPHVGCQSCHGPGGDHVNAMNDGRPASGYGFSQKSAFEEVQMCGRCHRLPGDGDVTVSPNDIKTVRFQSVGLLQSRCFLDSQQSLRCSTCHNPHQPVSREPSHYVARCLECHGQPESTHCSVSPQHGCVECHMPAVDIHRGITFHDHWIRARPESSAGQGSTRKGSTEGGPERSESEPQKSISNEGVRE